MKGCSNVASAGPCGGSVWQRAGDSDETQVVNVLEIPDPTPEKASREPPSGMSAEDQRRAYQGPAAARVETLEAFTPSSEASGCVRGLQFC